MLLENKSDGNIENNYGVFKNYKALQANDPCKNIFSCDNSIDTKITAILECR